ncbi:2-phosphosulfolactate phosphatase [Paenibacillus marinisediminis]
MHIDVIASVGESRVIDLTHRTVIVIDALRATSTIVTALAHGALGVVPVETVGQAKQCCEPDDVLGGERFCKKIAGFHVGNSPFEYMNEEIRGKRIVMTTTNGTRAIQKAIRAERILAGSFLNARACAQAAWNLRKDVALLCAGTQDTFALEDGLCAGLLLHELMKTAESSSDSVTTNDLGSMSMSAYLHHEANLYEVLLNSSSGRRLSKLGYTKDIEYCSTVNSISLVPHYDQLMMIPMAI